MLEIIAIIYRLMEIEWKISKRPVEYPEAMEFMETRVADIISGKKPELIWLLEHPALYTAGTSAKDSDLLDKKRFPVFKTGRGGEYTYHGPGQRIVYAMLDLKKRYEKPDLKKYIYDLEEWVIQTLAHFDIKGERRKGRVGIWVLPPSPFRGEVWDGGVNTINHQPSTINQEAKIAAIGVRVRKWVAYHGISININPDLSHFSGIIPCGIKEHGVTSLDKLGVKTDKKHLESYIKESFTCVFR